MVAVAHSILITSCYILKDDVPYLDLSGGYFTRRADPNALPTGSWPNSNGSATPSRSKRQRQRRRSELSVTF